MADPTLLSWISTEVDQALNLVRDKIARYTNERADDALLKVCPEHLHQVSGALRMVGLSGATRFCEAIEGSFGNLNGKERASLGIIDRAVLALKEFVDDLAHGEANQPLRLFPAYKDLAALQGKAEGSEKDLFFPDLNGAVPEHPQAKKPAQGELVPYLQAQRARFQRGVLGWLRNQPAGLEDMRGAIDAMHQVAGLLPEPRGVWWAGSALLEAMQAAKISAADAEWASAKALANKVDFYIRDLAAGQHKGNEPLLREVLYTIGKSKLETPQIKEVRQVYRLDALFPEQPKTGAMEYNMEWLTPELSDVRSRLEALKGVWLQYVSGEPKSVARFRELVTSFKAKATELGNAPLQKLLDAIALVCNKLPDPHPQQNQFMVIEMASAFLLVEQVVETFTNPPDDLEQQIGIMGGWLLDASKGKSTGHPPQGLRADLSKEIGAMQLRAQVAKEILTNLQHVEQVLDAFARDGSKRESLNGLGPYLRQIHGALVVLGFERPAEVLSICETMIAALAAADHPQAAQDMDWIAEGLSSLGFYLDPCLRGQDPQNQAITLFFRRYEQRVAGTEAAPGTMPPRGAETQIIPELLLDDVPGAVTAVDSTIVLEKPADRTAPMPAPADGKQHSPHVDAEPSRPPVNPELLEIYLDEAGEVLETINNAVPECRAQPQNRDALTTIRRGFHTLKGSGRMVGLMDLGEVAWEIEQVMNRWLEQQRPATNTLLELITMASGAFAGWVKQLREGTLQGEINGGKIVELARKLKSGEITEPPAGAAAPAAETEEVEIGGVKMAKSFFDIYLGEAQGHIATLVEESRRWSAAPGPDATHEFRRAAHTLASSSATAGFENVAELSGALEQWMPFARQTTEADIAPIRHAVERLTAMVEALGKGDAPGSGAEEAEAVHALIGRLQASPPAPQEATKSALEGIELDLTLTPDVVEKKEEAPAAPAPASQPTGRELRKMHDDIDEQLLPIFLE